MSSASCFTNVKQVTLLLKVMTDQFEYLKEEKSQCLSSLESKKSLLKGKHDITPF